MDLFEQDDKRLTLKPVKDFSDLVQSAFGDGHCTCILCINDGAGPAPKQPPHTFEIDGAPVNRRFAISAYSDVRGALAKAWESYYKIGLPAQGLVDIEAVTVLVGTEARQRMLLLLVAAGVVKDIDEALHFASSP